MNNIANAHELEKWLEGQVLSGRVAENQPMPSVRQLARDTGLAPGTVAKAYGRLIERGLLRTVPRKGTVVAPNPRALPQTVLDAAREYAATLSAHHVNLEDGQRLLAVLLVPQPSEHGD